MSVTDIDCGQEDWRVKGKFDDVHDFPTGDHGRGVFGRSLAQAKRVYER